MQQVWRKRWQNTAWVGLAAITLVLLVGAVYKKNHSTCTGIEVTFRGDVNFIDDKGVLAVLMEYGEMKGLPLESIDLKVLETKLEHDTWIANAELFFDNKQVLQVSVEEKLPVARVFTTAGSSFYIDSAGKRLPLSAKLTARTIVFTSFPSDKDRLSKPDSELLASVKEVAMFIQHDEFWNAQVEQIDITPEGFEMFPMLGSHVVILGKGGDWQRKFDKLFSFYKQVWTTVGFEKYDKLDVQFDGQIVATIRGAKPAVVDSAKAKAAYEKLIAELKKSTVDTVLSDDKVKPAVKDKPDGVKPTALMPAMNDKPKAVMVKTDTLKIAAPKASSAKKDKSKLLVAKPVMSSVLAVPKSTMNKMNAAAKPVTAKATTATVKPAKTAAAQQQSLNKPAVNKQGAKPSSKQAPKATMKKS